jgi:hypothetical protein
VRPGPSQCEVRIVSAAGELRHARVSGFEKTRLRWLFRNFGVLEFSVLNEKQRLLIADLWNAEPAAGSGNPPATLIGTIEGFSPRSYPPPVSAQNRIRERRFLGTGLPNPALLTAIGILLVLGSLFVRSKLRLAQPQHPLAAIESLRAVKLAHPILPPISTQAASAVASLPSVPNAAASGSLAHHAPADHADDKAAPSPLMLPEMRSGKKETGAKKSTVPQAAREVIIRAAIDSEGRSQSFEVLRGNQHLVALALQAAKRWRFQPCSRVEGCEQLLKFTDYGDASSLQIVDECASPGEGCITVAARSTQ